MIPADVVASTTCARRVPPDATRVLLRLPSWLGDIVMARPAIAAIAASRPRATFVAQAPAPFLPLAARFPGVSSTLSTGRDRTPRDLAASRRRLREEHFDAAVVFPRGHRAALAPFLAGIPVRVGFAARGKGPLLTHGVRGWGPLRRTHRSRFFAALATAFDADLAPPLAPLPVLAPERDAARRLLLALGRRTTRPLVALEAGASYGPAKCWPVERFAELAERLGRDGIDVVAVGTIAAAPIEAAIASRAPDLLRAVGRTSDLGVLIGLLAEADGLVTNDTGPMHLAAAVGTPVVALFGATDPNVSAPLGPGPCTLIQRVEPCSPCFLRECPIPGHPCLAGISTARVLAAIRAVVGPA